MLFHVIITAEFLYPLTTINYQNEEKLLVLYQNNNHLEIFFWDPITLVLTKALLSSFTPAGATVVPDTQSFSFIDHDRIRIKNLCKRSPKTIDIPYGPYDINLITWESSTRCYFAAHEHNHRTIFFAGINGELARLFPPFYGKNIGYPQKINDVLFFVGKEDEGKSTIEMTFIEEQDLKNAFLQNTDIKNNHKIFSIKKNYDTQIIFSLENKDEEIIFLFMDDLYQGYFITHSCYVDRQDKVITFTVHAIKKTIDINQIAWSYSELFSFSIPLYFFISDDFHQTRLYESILPLIPYYSKNNIFYTHATQEGVSLYIYDIFTKKSSLLVPHEKENHKFKIVPYKDILYYGGTVCNQNSSCQNHTHVHTWLTSAGVLHCQLPHIS